MASEAGPDGTRTMCFYVKGKPMKPSELHGPSLGGVGCLYHEVKQMIEATADLNKGTLLLTEREPQELWPREHMEEIAQARLRGRLLEATCKRLAGRACARVP